MFTQCCVLFSVALIVLSKFFLSDSIIKKLYDGENNPSGWIKPLSKVVKESEEIQAVSK